MLSFHTEHANCILNNFQKSFTNFKHLPLLSWKCTSKKKKETMTETLFTLAWKSLSANAVQKVCQSVLCLFLCQCLQPWANYLAWGELWNSPTPQLPPLVVLSLAHCRDHQVALYQHQAGWHSYSSPLGPLARQPVNGKSQVPSWRQIQSKSLTVGACNHHSGSRGSSLLQNPPTKSTPTHLSSTD